MVVQSLTKRRGTEKHGGYYTPEYSIWMGMIQRCTNSNNMNYKYYGARGIKVCDRWLLSFRNFLADMGSRPSSEHLIDRINNDGNYEPSNCKWNTSKIQNYNRRPKSLKTHCKYDHELTEENLYYKSDGKHECFLCKQRRKQEENNRNRLS